MKEYVWYVEPLDSHTNEVIARELSEVSFQRDLPDENGVLRRVWECEFSFVAVLRRGLTQQNLKFLVFVREGHGKMRSAAFLGKRKRRRPAGQSRAA